ncbi:LAGLIDADG family homing endonuclease [Kribbella ginsengisoli]|uniref:DOD-type homing endonuclease domain-containing protein n=1 Tax=Kribbella ginsengisoli TaxID=363865 RepID=A0ABP6XJX3_9ACTN
MTGRYQVMRQDGFTAIVESAHLWRVHLDSRKDRIVDTPELRRLVNSSARVRLPQPPVISYDLPAELPIEPYLMGLLLGEGGMSGNGLHFTNVDEEIVQSVQNLLPPGHVIKSHIANERAVAGNWRIVGSGGKNGNVIINELRALGLLGSTARTKFIPAAYRRGSEDDRLALLQGLMDSDGHAGADGRLEFSSSSRWLAEDLLELVRSLGGHAAMHAKTKVTYTSPTQLTPKSARPAYRVQNINMPSHNPFRLTRKAVRFRPRNGAWARRIRLVELMLPGCRAELAPSAQPFYDGFSWKQVPQT